MNKHRIALVLIIAVTLSWYAIASAHRYFSEPPPPIVVEDIEYRAPQDVAHMGYVQAFDRMSGQKLWESKLYSVWINPLSEADVQWIFINKIQFKAGELLVTNELGNSFRLNPATGKIKNRTRNYLSPIILVSVPIIFLIIICIAIILAIKLLFARANKHYSSSQDEKKIYKYFWTTGGVLSGLLALFVSYSSLRSLFLSVIEAIVDGSFFFGNIIIPDMDFYLGQFLFMTVWFVSVFSVGVYISSLLGELTISIKRKTKGI